MSEVITRTQQLISYLRELADTSNLTKEQLQQLETVAKNLRVGDVTNINDAVNLISTFRENLRQIGVDSIGIYNATQYYIQLTRALNLANIEQERFNALAIAKQAKIDMSKLGTPGYGGLGIGYTPDEQAKYAELERTRANALAQARNLYQQSPAQRVQIEGQYGEYVHRRVALEDQATMELENQRNIQNMLFEIERKRDELAVQRLQKEQEIASSRAGFIGRYGGATKPFIAPSDEEKRISLGDGEKPDITEEQGPISAEGLQRLGLSAAAAENLQRKLKDLKMEEGRVITNTRELSTGIQTVSFSFQKGKAQVQTYTAHLDPLGNILQDTQRRFRSFGSAVMRDVVEVLKWTIAIGAIYGPMRKLGELLQEAKDVQLALVDVQIVLGDSTEKLQGAFEAAARVATETSSSLVGVIQGYSLAASAAASAGNDFERLAATESLLKNSMILSKLAGIDQKQALDTLVGAISQAGLKLTDGTRLLDSWVAVAKRSNSTVAQMATTFSIVGSAAQEVGLTFDELNAMVGAMAQATNLSADEIGNAIRGIIAAMQTDKASAEFAKYGIATKTLSGDMRDLMEILREVKVMQQTGILDEKAMGALMEAGGAGARRGAQLSALVKNLGMVMDLVTVSQNANGDAAKAMALELETLDAAATRLNNAFTELAKTLGGEGGLLDFLTLATEGATLLVKGIRELVGVMKWAAPVFATFLLAKGISGTATGINLLGNYIPRILQTTLTSTPALSGIASAAENAKVAKSISNQITDRLNQVTGRAGGTEALTYGALLSGINNKLMQPLFYRNQQAALNARTASLGIGGGLLSPTGILSKINLMSLIGPAIVAATNLGRPKEEGIPRAIAGGIGALPGILMGNPVWATIGSIIATGFYDKFLTLEGDMANAWAQFVSENPQRALTAKEAATPQNWSQAIMAALKETLEGPPPPPEKPLEPELPTLEELLKDLDKSIINNMTTSETLGINLQQTIGSMALTKEQRAAGMKDVYQNENMLILATYLAQKQGKTLEGNIIGTRVGGNVVTASFTKETMDAIEKYLNLFIIKQVEKGLTPTTIETAKNEEIQKLAQLASTASADLMTKALKEIASGATSGLTNLSAAQQIVTTLQTSAGTLIEAQQRTPGMKAITGPEAINLLTNLTPDEAAKLQTAASDITSGLAQLETVQNKINEQRAAGIQIDKDYLDTEKQLNETIANAIQIFPQLYAALKQVSLARQAEAMMKPIIEVPEGMTAEQLKDAIAGAEEMWNRYLESQNIPPEMLEAWKAQQNDQILMAKDEVFSMTTKVPSKFLNLQLEKMGITGPGTQIQDYRQLTKAQMAGMMPQYTILKQQLQQLGFKVNEEDILAQNKDGWSLLHFDNVIMQLLMNDLIDETKKQGLQGMYNLPAGATFYVPVTAYEMSKATVTEMAGGGGGLAGLSDIIAQLAELIRLLGIKPVTPSRPEVGDWLHGRGAPLPPALPVVQTPSRPGIGDWMHGRGAPPPPLTEDKIKEKIIEIDKIKQRNEPLLKDTLSSYIPETNQKPISTALNLAVDSTIRLVVDGRTLATIIKPYLYQDLIRFNTSTATSISRSVIA